MESNEEKISAVFFIFLICVSIASVIAMSYVLLQMKKSADIAHEGDVTLFREQIKEKHCVHTRYYKRSSNKVWLCNDGTYMENNSKLWWIE